VKWFRLFSLFCVSSCAWSAQAQSPASGAVQSRLDKIVKTNSIIIAHRENVPPFVSLDEVNKPVGYVIDICTALVERIKKDYKLANLEIKYLLVNAESIADSLNTGKADMECGISINRAERRNYLSFTMPYFYSMQKILVSKNSSIKEWSDLRNKRIVTTRGSGSLSMIQDAKPTLLQNVGLLEGGSHKASFAMLEAGKADAYIADEVNLAWMKSNSKLNSEWKIVGQAIGVEAKAIALPINDKKWKDYLDSQLAFMMRRGDATKIYEKWFMQTQEKTGKNLELPINFLLREHFKLPTDYQVN
jgi:glutamate/aspartate transport system substrate-binding protein